jgi:hypothetical protein
MHGSSDDPGTPAAGPTVDGGDPSSVPADGMTSAESDGGPTGSPIPQGLSLVAGQIGGTGNTDGTGATARFFVPSGVVYDAGNLYVVDYLNQSIRKIVLATGTVTTFVGQSGHPGTLDGTGTSAELEYPRGGALDGAGNLYVTTDSTIRKIVLSTGAVSTLAGSGSTGSADGIGIAATFSYPTGIAADRAGNLYVSDGNCIRKIVLSTKAVTTIAGSAISLGSTDGIGSAARFYSPAGLAYDAGALYIADSRNNTIRKLVLATGAVTTVAGTVGQHVVADGTGAAAHFSDPEGIAFDGAGALYIADAGGPTLRKLVLATGVVTTVAGAVGQGISVDGIGTAAHFMRPHGVASDGAGKIYVADDNDCTIRQLVVATGAMTTVAGGHLSIGNVDGVGAAARFRYPRGVASDGAGNLYVADQLNAVVRKIALATGEVSAFAGNGSGVILDGIGTAAGFRIPLLVAADGAGNLYVADSNVVRKIVIATRAVTTLAGNPNTFTTVDGVGTAASFGVVSGIVYDAGELYVSDNDTIRKIDVATGAVTTFAGSAGSPGSTDGIGTAARFDVASGLVTDGAGNLYVAEFKNATIRKIVLASGQVTTIAGAAGVLGSTDGVGSAARFSSPYQLALTNGALYVSDRDNVTIRKIVLATATVSTPVGVVGHTGVLLGAFPARLNSPAGLATVGNDLYIVDNLENAVLVAHGL